MNENQKAIFIIIYFLCMLPLSYLSRRWLWKQVCAAGGTTVEESRNKQREFAQQGGNWQLQYQSWIMENAPDIAKYNRLYKLYQFCLAPNLIFCFFSFTGLYTHALDKVLVIGMVIVPIVIVVTSVVGAIHKKQNKE